MGALAATHVSYWQWAERLFTRFFCPENAGQPVTFFIDDEVAGELSGLGDGPAGVFALASAVKNRLDVEAGNVFHKIDDDYRQWKMRQDNSAPPSLPLLALTVLAASRMARGEGFSAANYYRPLRQLLELPGAGAPHGYDETVPWLWEELKSWLNDGHHGDLGVSTVVGNRHFVNIGYALSQALFRTADRQRLTHFFQWIDLKPGEHISPNELLALFRSWAPRRANMHKGVLQMAASDNFSEQLAGILATEAAHWDGTLRDEAGRRLGRILLTLELYPRAKLGLTAQCPPGFPVEASFLSSMGPPVRLTRAAEGWYSAITDASLTETLRSGLKLVSGNFALEYKPGDVIPLAEDTLLGCWSSIRQLTPADAHWILVGSERTQAVAQYLEQCAEKGWQMYQRPGLLPTGWVLFRDVVINSTTPGVPAALLRISPTVRERPALWGGLPLLPGHNTYLGLGEPDLWIPDTFETTATFVSVDGRRIVRPEDGRLSTHLLGLSDGVHQIEVGPSRLQFGTIRTLGTVQAAETGKLAHAIRDDGGHTLALSLGPSITSTDTMRDVIRICGAHVQTPMDMRVQASPKPPLLLPKGARAYVLLGKRPGELQRVRDGASPAWLRDLPLYPKVFEVTPLFDVVWVIIQWVGAKSEARIKTELEPSPDPADGVSQQAISEWKAQFARDFEIPRSAASLWQRYAQRALG